MTPVDVAAWLRALAVCLRRLSQTPDSGYYGAPVEELFRLSEYAERAPLLAHEMARAMAAHARRMSIVGRPYYEQNHRRDAAILIWARRLIGMVLA